MRIAVVTGNFPKLSETFVLNQVTGLLDLGHDVRVIARWLTREVQEHEDVDRYGLRKRLRVLELSRKAWSRGSEEERHATALRAELERSEFDSILCHFGPHGELAARALSPGSRVPLLTIFHGYDVRRALERGAGIYETLFTRGDRFLGVSHYTVAKLLQLGAPRERVVHHPMGIDPRRFHPQWTARRKGDLPRPLVLLTVARLHEVKGHEHAIGALRLLLDARPGVALEYRLVGDGPREAELREWVKELGLDSTVVFRGALQHRQVLAELARAHLFVLPSVAEALPVVLMEAQAAGLPVVATRVGGVAELVHEGRSGYLVPPRDPAALARALAKLVDSPESWPALGRVGRSHVEEHHDVRQLNRRLERLLLSHVS